MKFRNIFVVAGYLLIVNVKTVDGFKNKSSYYRLYEHLLEDQGYNRFIRPVVNSTQATVVNISLILLNIIDYNEVAEKFTIAGELKISWMDEYLTWDAASFDGLDSLNLPQDSIWKPDIGLDNSVTRHGIMGASSMFVRVQNDGSVMWNPMEVFHSACPSDVTKYPMDVQKCCLNFEAWNFASNVVRIQKEFDNVNLDHGYDGLPQWLIKDTSAVDGIVGGDFYVTFCITLRRQSLYVMLNIILPIAMLSFLNCCVFLLPAASGEKASFSVTVFLSLCVFLTIISAQLPKSSDKVSMFNLYVFSQALISTFVTFTVLMQVRFFHRSEKRVVPLWLRKLVVCCQTGRHKTEEERNEVVELKPNENGLVKRSGVDSPIDNHTTCFKSDDAEANHVTWKFVAEWLDPTLFMFFSCLNMVFSLSLLIWSWSV